MSVMSVPGPLSRGARRFEFILAALFVAFSGLCAGFIARNSDIWQHLAMGRMVSAGDYDFYSDPLSYAPAHERWVNHAWLSEWAGYQFFRTFGGPGLLVIKALMVTLIVGLVIRNLTPDRPRWLALVFATGIMSVWSQRMNLQPILLSCLALGVMLHCLRVGGRAYRYVPVLILLWANVDEWFILGPVVVVLWWLGARYQRSQSMPNWIPIASLLACLVTPFHIHGFTLPAEVSPAFWMSDLARDPKLRSQFASPFNSSAWTGWISDSAATWITAIALFVSAVLYVVLRKSLGIAAVFVGLIFLALAVWQARLLPFFAVVSLILLTPRVQTITPPARLGRVGRGLTGVVLLACLGAVWLGRLPGARDRILGLDVVADPSWVQAAETVQEYRRMGILSPDTHILATSPDAANTLAWFAAGEKGWLDTRWGWHARNPKISSLDVSGEFGLGTEVSDKASQQKLEDHSIALVLLSDSQAGLLQPMLAKGSRWRVVKLDGRTVWLQPKFSKNRSPQLEQIRFNPEELAFGNHTSSGSNISRLPIHPTWWQPFSRKRWLPGPDSSKSQGFLDFSIASQSPNPALTLLAIQSARKAIEINPEDAQAWYELGRAYTVLATNSERSAAGSGFHLELRRVQRIITLSGAAIANPELEPVREALAATFAEFGYLDFSLMHRQYQYQLLIRRGEIERARMIREVMDELEATLLDRESLYHIRTRNMSGEPLTRARIALELGLARQAEETLLKSSPELFGTDGLKMLARLLLMSGQASEASVLLNRQELLNNPSALGIAEIPCQDPEGKRTVFRLPAYDWFRFLLDSSTGKSDPRTFLTQLNSQLTRDQQAVNQLRNSLQMSLVNQLAVEIGFADTSLYVPRTIIQQQREQLVFRLSQLKLLDVEKGELAVLEGILELESGNSDVALLRFKSAIAEYDRATSELKLAPSRRLAEQYRNQIEKQRPGR